VEFRRWVDENALREGKAPLSAHEILLQVRNDYPDTEISSEFEIRQLLKAVAFRFVHIHSSYYTKISLREDVVLHRKLMIPILLMTMTDPRCFLVNFDFSFIYQNQFSKSAWASLTRENSDMIDAKPGKGPRISTCEFISRDGVLRHPDGKSAGTKFTKNEVITADIVKECIKRGCEAITDHPRVVKGSQPFLFIDNARVQTTKPSTFINPNDMNLSDGGENRVEMDVIGNKGLRSVLTDMARWKAGMRLQEARELLWSSSLVQSQLTMIEEICRENGIILIYNAKAHPWFAMIEKLWRWLKYQLENLLSLSEINKKYDDLIENMMSEDPVCRKKCEKWFTITLKYVQYYACGGTKVVRERDMRHLDLTDIGDPVPRARYSSFENMLITTHDANWIAICGKRYKRVAEYWK
jgi:hypothetical protein